MSRHTITKKIFSAFVTAISCGAFFVNNPLFAMNEEDVAPLIANVHINNAYTGFDTYVGTKENGFYGRKEFMSPSGLVVDQSLQLIRKATENDKRQLKQHPIMDCLECNNCLFGKDTLEIIALPDKSRRYILVETLNKYPSRFARITNEGKIDWVRVDTYSGNSETFGPSYFNDTDLQLFDRSTYDL